jgi:hypothetical protein
MSHPFQENPYEPPVMAELVEPRRAVEPFKPLPVGSIALGLVLTFGLSVGLGFGISGWFCALFPAACIATLVFMVAYDLRRWFRS